MKSNDRNLQTKMRMREKRNGAGLLIAMLLGLAGILPLTASTGQDGLPGMEVQPVEYFYTGKPYDSDSESYTFRYRNYDSELNRWTTVDPSGFPDGANNTRYTASPTSSIDPLGLQEINTVADAITWFNVGEGANATAGSQLINGVKASDSYSAQITIGMETSINGKLSAVDRSLNSGTITGTGHRGLYHGSVLGSFALHIDYSATWTASEWVNEVRTVTANVTLQLWINENYDFEPNAEYSDFQNLTQELIPGWIAEYSYPGQGTDYWIQASFTDTINGIAYQNE